MCPLIELRKYMYYSAAHCKGNTTPSNYSIYTFNVKISPRVGQKRLRFNNKTGAREFMKFTKKYHQQIEAEQANIGRIVRAMSPPKLADIGVQLQEASHD